MFNGEIIFHKKDTEKVVFSTSERLDNDIKSSSGLKNLFVHFYHAPNILLWGTKYCARKQLCNNTLDRRNELKVLISPPGRPVPCQWWKINGHSLQIAKASFKYPQVLCFFIVVHPSTKSLVQQGFMALHLHQILQSFQSWTNGFYWYEHVQMYILTEGRNFRTFLKENYVIAWVGQPLRNYWNIRNVATWWNWTWYWQCYKWSLYTLGIYSRFDMSTLQFKQMMNLSALDCNISSFFICFLWGSQVSYNPWWLQILGSISKVRH